MGIKKHLFLIGLIFWSSFSYSKNSTTRIEESLGVKIVTQEVISSTWPEVSYALAKDSARINFYLKILAKEYQKYPQGYLLKSNVNSIVICEDLKFENTNRAAIPDPYKKVLYLAIDQKYPEHYLIHVMHHELHHSTEYAIFGDMFYSWKKWSRKNKRRFSYGNGGSEAYKKENKSIDYYSMTHPQKGFVNWYSTMGQEEDRCELVGLLLNEKTTTQLMTFCKEDRILKRKVKLIIRTLNKHAGFKLLSWRKLKKM